MVEFSTSLKFTVTEFKVRAGREGAISVLISVLNYHTEAAICYSACCALQRITFVDCTASLLCNVINNFMQATHVLQERKAPPVL